MPSATSGMIVGYGRSRFDSVMLPSAMSRKEPTRGCTVRVRESIVSVAGPYNTVYTAIL